MAQSWKDGIIHKKLFVLSLIVFLASVCLIGVGLLMAVVHNGGG